MPQQINLCTPILLAQKRYFSADTMVQALAIFLLVGGGLSAYWVWSLNAASAGFKATLEAQSRDLEKLQAALQQGTAGAEPAKAALAQELATRRTALQRREKLLEELQRGHYPPGWGHSARLNFVAQSMPKSVWVTELKVDENQLELSGLTLDPASINLWAAKLVASPLFKGQKLSAFKVEKVSPQVKTAFFESGAGAAIPFGSSVAVAPPADGRLMWSFHWVSSRVRAVKPEGSNP